MNSNNNFKMSSKLSREKQKQKYDLLFKYVKSIDTFDSASIQNESECKSALERFYKRAALDEKSSVMDIQSNVFEWIIKNPQGKKRVKFSDEVVVNNCSTKGNTSNGDLRVKHEPNPEQIKKDLEDLQSSVFSMFKIKPERQNRPFSSQMFESIPQTSSLMLESRVDFNKRKIQDEEKPIKRQTQVIPQIVRSKSELFTSGNIKFRQMPSTKSKVSNQEKSKTGNATNRLKISRSSSESGFSRGISESYENLIKRGTSSSLLRNRSTSLARSDSFWKQQNNLMVQIFKNKLNTNTKR